MSTTISIMLDDCLLQIFDQLPLCDLFKIDQVCQRWRSLTSEAFARRRHLTVIVAQPNGDISDFSIPLPHQLFPMEKLSILIPRIAEIESRSTLVFKAYDDLCKSTQKAQIEMPCSEDEPHTMLARFVRAKSFFCQISEFIPRTFTRINSLNIIIACRNVTYINQLIRLLQNRRIVDRLCALQIWNRFLFSESMDSLTINGFLDAISDCRRVKSLLLDLFGSTFVSSYNPMLSGIIDKLSELIKLLPLERFHISLHNYLAPYYGELAKALKRRIDKSRTMIGTNFRICDITSAEIPANSILATASKQITHLYETIRGDEMLRFTSQHFTRLTYLSVMVLKKRGDNLTTFSYVIDSIEPLVELRHLVLMLVVLSEDGVPQNIFERSNAKNSDPTKPWPVLGSIRTLGLIEQSLHHLPYKRSFPGKSVFPAVVEFHFWILSIDTECLTCAYFSNYRQNSTQGLQYFDDYDELKCDVHRRENATNYLDLCRTIVDQLPAVRRVYCANTSHHFKVWNRTPK